MESARNLGRKVRVGDHAESFSSREGTGKIQCNSSTNPLQASRERGFVEGNVEIVTLKKLKKRKLGEGFLMLKLILKAGIGNRRKFHELFFCSKPLIENWPESGLPKGIPQESGTPSESMGSDAASKREA